MVLSFWLCNPQDGLFFGTMPMGPPLSSPRLVRSGWRNIPWLLRIARWLIIIKHQQLQLINLNGAGKYWKWQLFFFLNSEHFQQVVYARAKWHHWSGENYYRIVVVLKDRKGEKMPLKIFTMSILRRKALQHARVGWRGRGAAAHFQVLLPNYVPILSYWLIAIMRFVAQKR